MLDLLRAQFVQMTKSANETGSFTPLPQLRLRKHRPPVSLPANHQQRRYEHQVNSLP